MEDILFGESAIEGLLFASLVNEGVDSTAVETSKETVAKRTLAVA